jgi:V-type H+-transporting ATPase subunit C
MLVPAGVVTVHFVQSREYDPAPVTDETEANPNEVTAKLRDQLNAKKADLGNWCKTSFSDAFASWIHICAVRLFVESVLRYGLPPKFLGVLLEPVSRHTAKLRKGLADAVASHGAQFWNDSSGGTTGPGVEGEMFPYVSFTLDVEA